MKLLELDLLAFGPFTDVRLDFSRDRALHLIYGPNEAGKSTALRAITNLFYGIPANTPDAHRHAMRDLRIGARIGTGNGAVLELVRRKGTKNTLLDPHDKPLGDDVIMPLLGGIGETLFRTVFGLNHETLRQGAEALLQGHGGVGESLFAAAIGGRGIHPVLEQLEKEASDLYKSRGQNPRLNESIRAFKEAESRSKLATKSGDAYRQQQEALDAARDEGAQLAEQRRQLGVEQSRLQRALSVLPRLAERRDLEDRLRRLGAIPHLPDDASRRRAEAMHETAEAARERDRLQREVETLEHDLASVHDSDSLLRIDERVIQDLQDQLGSHRKAAKDLPQRRTELRLLEEDVLAIPARLGRPVALEQIESLRIPAALQARIRTLAQQRSGLHAALEHAQLELEERRALLDRQRTLLASLPARADAQPLQQVLARAQRLADVDDEIEAAAAGLDALEHEVQRRVAALGLWQGDVATLRALPLPDADTLAGYENRFDSLQRASEDLTRRQAECERRAARLQRDLDELYLVGDVPTEQQLVEQRQQRDQLWRDVRRDWSKGTPGAAARADEFERSLREADGLADRLRREAHRVAIQAKLQAELAEVLKDREVLERERAALGTWHDQLHAEWTAAWGAAGVDPLRPPEMRGWLARVATIVELAAERDVQRTAVAKLRARCERQRGEIGAALQGVGESSVAAGAFAAVLAQAERVLAERTEHNAQRRERESTISGAEAQLPELQRRDEHARQRLDSWEDDWSDTVAPLGLGGRATTEEALAVLDQLKDLFGKIEAMQHQRRRVDTMEADAARLGADIMSLADQYAPELRELPLEQCGDGLIRAYGQAQHDQRERRRIERELQQRREQLAEYEQRSHRAAATLAELLHAAGVGSVDELEKIEIDAAEHAAVERRLQEVDTALLELGEGATIEELIEQTHGLDSDAAKARLNEITSQLEDIDERRDPVAQSIVRLEIGLKQWETGDSAADAAAEAQEYLADIKEDVRKYVRLRLAALVLRREIERYRVQNEGPLLSRAGELFPRLTLGSFSGLRVGFDTGDDPVLRCVRPDGSEQGVETLSDGARDQLYLALRIATLERHAALNQPMPVVLDDVLIHFDKRRAPAALEVLAELAAQTQVLFFTHDAGLIALARQTLPDAVRVEHVLGTPR